MQQHVAADDLLARAQQELDDGGFLFGQPDLLVVVAHQHLGRGLERIGTDLENGILAVLVLAQMGTNAGQQHAEAEGLGHIVIGAGVKPEDGIGIRCLAGEHDHRALVAVAADDLASLAPVHVRQVDVEKDQIGMIGLHRLNTGGGVGGIGDNEFVMQRELLLQRLTQHVIVVDDDDLLGGAHSQPFEISCPRPCG